jgi:zinc/manganese transport system substrate-binding protein
MINIFKCFVASFCLFAVLAFTSQAEAKLNVVTTTPDLAVVISEVGGDHVSVQSLSKGTQDPHFLEAKPSFMVKVNRADLMVSTGLELEIGWLPPIIQGARNPNVMPGSEGYLEVGQFITPIELPSTKVTRAEGDVHPFGNPHFMLDPIRAGQVAVGIAGHLAEMDPDHAAIYKENASKLKTRLEEKTKAWQKRIAKSGVTEVVTYHKTLNYFLDRFGIGNPINLEPKPGIPPTAQHIMEVIRVVKEKNIKLVMIENFYDKSFADKIVSEVPKIKVDTIPVEVGGDPSIKTLDDLYEHLVSVIEEAGK